jgi:hypothetical protein
MLERIPGNATTASRRTKTEPSRPTFLSKASSTALKRPHKAECQHPAKQCGRVCSRLVTLDRVHNLAVEVAPSPLLGRASDDLVARILTVVHRAAEHLTDASWFTTVRNAARAAAEPEV